MSEPAKMTSTPLLQRALRILPGGCALLLLAGHLLPWAVHKAAALTLSANDLGFFTNFTPGAGIFWNEWFYLPVWMAALLLVIGYRPSPANRLLLMALALGIASLGLPRYEQLVKFLRTPMQALRESDFTLQLALALLVMGLVAALSIKPARFLTMRQPSPIYWGVAGLICAVPLVGYLSVKPFIAALYGDVISIGIGWWLTLLADLLLWAMTFATIVRARSAHRTTTKRTAAY
jgi:hypothetical protein